jgi:hypothetical protein
MLLAPGDAHGQHVPSERVLDARVRVVDEHARVDASQASLSLQEVRQILAVRLRLDLEEPRKAVLVEQTRRERVRGGQTADRVSGVGRRTPELEHRAVNGTTTALAHVRSSRNWRIGLFR